MTRGVEEANERWGERCTQLVFLMMFTGETVDGRGPIVGTCTGRVTVNLMSLTVTALQRYLGVSPLAIAEEICSTIYKNAIEKESFPGLSNSFAEIVIHWGARTSSSDCFSSSFFYASSTFLTCLHEIRFDNEKTKTRKRNVSKVLFSTSTRMKKGRSRR